MSIWTTLQRRFHSFNHRVVAGFGRSCQLVSLCGPMTLNLGGLGNFKFRNIRSLKRLLHGRGVIRELCRRCLAFPSSVGLQCLRMDSPDAVAASVFSDPLSASAALRCNHTCRASGSRGKPRILSSSCCGGAVRKTSRGLWVWRSEKIHLGSSAACLRPSRMSSSPMSLWLSSAFNRFP